MTIEVGHSTASSSTDLANIVKQLINAERVEDCIDARECCFAHYQLADYILLPNNPRGLPMITSKSAEILALAKRLEACQEKNSAFSFATLPQFPFRASDMTDLAMLMPEPDTALDGNCVSLNDAYVLPVQGDTEKALLFIWGSDGALAEDQMLALQAVCTNSIKRIEGLQHQQDNEDPLAPLSQIELSLLKGMASGRKQDEIAQDYGLSPQTISLFSNQITRKLGANSLRQAISLARDTSVH